MSARAARYDQSNPVRLVIGLILTPILGWWFWVVNATGTISVRVGSRGARTTFAADRLTDPDQFYVALAFVGLLFLLSLAALLSVAWDLVAADRRDSDLR